MADRESKRPALTADEVRARAGEALVAGVDEAGRGPWAGPVVVAAVMLDPRRIPAGLDDSKVLSARRREQLFEAIVADHHVAIASASARRIDAVNIRAATLEAMSRAVLALDVPPGGVLIDGRDVPPGLGRLPAAAVIDGDALVAAISAASIVAKVTRDRIMTRLGRMFDGYGFERHMGYGTPMHAEALARLGPCAIHRLSFRPIARLLER